MHKNLYQKIIYIMSFVLYCLFWTLSNKGADEHLRATELGPDVNQTLIRRGVTSRVPSFSVWGRGVFAGNISGTEDG